MSSAPPVPGVRGAVRSALADLYHHSIRFVPLNLLWALGAIFVLGIGLAAGPLVALVISPLLAIPLVGLARLAGEVVRGREVVLSDAWDAMRGSAVRAIGAGAVMVAVGTVLLTNVLLGLASGSPLSVALAVLAVWGLIALVLVALPFWVLLADPERPDRGLGGAARDAAALLLVAPARLIVLAVVVGIVLVVGTVLVAAILTVCVAYAVLVTARVVLPASGRLAGSPDMVSTSDPPGAR